MSLKKTYTLFRMGLTQRHLGLSIEPIKTIFAKKEGISNLSEAYDYFLPEILELEKNEEKLINNTKSEVAHSNYFVAFSYKLDMSEELNNDLKDNEEDHSTWGQKRGLCDSADNCYSCPYSDKCF
jgi:hypothetical protein